MWRRMRSSKKLLHTLTSSGNSNGNSSDVSNSNTLVRDVSNILAVHKNWRSLLDRPSLTPDVIRSVITLNLHSPVISPARLRDMFNWWWSSSPGNHTDPTLLCTLSVLLCNAHLPHSASPLLQRAVASHSSPFQILAFIRHSHTLFPSNSPLVFDVLIDSFRLKSFLFEAVTLFLTAPIPVPHKDQYTPSLLSSNLLLTDLFKFKKLDLFWKVILKMSHLKIEPDASTYTLIIAAHFKASNVSEARRVFFACTPTVATHNAFIKGLCRAGLVDEAIQTKDSMSQNGLSPTVYTFANLINGVCRQHRASQANSLLLEMKNMGFKPDVVVYNALILMFAKIDLNQAFRIWDEIVAASVVIHIHLCNSLICGACKAGQMQKAKGIVNEMIVKGIKPDQVTYTLLIEGHLQGRDFVSAFELLTEMNKNGTPPTLRTYRQVIKGLKRILNIKQIDAVSEGGLDAEDWKPNAVTYTTLIIAYAREGRLDDSVTILNCMKNQGLLPDVMCYNAIINGFIAAKNMECANNYLLEMLENELNPDVYTYGAFILSYSKAGEMKIAERLFNEMLGRSISPNVKIYTALIEGHCKNGNITEAFSVFRRTLALGGFPEVQANTLFIDILLKKEKFVEGLEVLEEFSEIKGDVPYSLNFNHLISNLCKQSEVEKAFQLYEYVCVKGINPDIATYNILMNGLCKANCIEEAKKVYDGLFKKGSMPNNDTYAAMIHGYCKSGNVVEAFKLLDEMQSSNIQPNSFIFNALLEGCCQEGKFEKAKNLYNEMMQKRLAFTSSFNKLIDWFCRGGKVQEAHELFTEMVGKKLVKPNHGTYETLIDQLYKAGNRVEIFALFKDMVARGIKPHKVVYSVIIDAHYKEGNSTEADKIKDEMLKKCTQASSNVMP